VSTLTLAPQTRTIDENDDYGFITADYETPVEDERSEDEVLRIRCDEQILAALVTF
jgi:hypothetical protein